MFAGVVGIVHQGPVAEHRDFAWGGALDLRIVRRQAGMVVTDLGLAELERRLTDSAGTSEPATDA